MEYLIEIIDHKVIYKQGTLSFNVVYGGIL